MKKAIIAIAVLIVMIGAFVFSYQYRNQKISQQTADITTTLPTHNENEAPADSAAEPDKTGLIAEDKENDYQIYFDGEAVTIVHGEYKRVFLSWAFAAKAETPKIFCKDYDGDGENELLIRIINGVNKSESGVSEYTYAVYLFKPITMSDGEKTFAAYIAAKDTWKEPFDNLIKCELTQLKSCKKFLQFTMDDIDENILYDEQTGITSNKHVAYATALSDSKKQYYTFDRWSRGFGIFNIDDEGDITLDIQVLVYYEETKSEHHIGNIHCKIDFINNKFSIVPNTIVFNPLEEFKATDPRDTASSNWKCVINNASENTNFKSTDIDWIEVDFSLSNTSAENKQYFESLPSKIKCVDSIEFSQDTIVLTAKKGYTFSPRMADKGDYSVILNSGEKDEIDISYTCTVITNSDSSTLTIHFDKSYDKEDFDKILIKFGV
ncbi:MAG: hypothetical protein K2H13_04480 [Eubacterium sp.]|nr:hypothetical protein [Eubacterium sp.]MDE6156049.1 hypothetical protein [Eubacterium sp.]